MTPIDALYCLPLAVLWWALRNDEKGYRYNPLFILHSLVTIGWIVMVSVAMAKLGPLVELEWQSLVVGVSAVLFQIVPGFWLIFYWDIDKRESP